MIVTFLILHLLGAGVLVHGGRYRYAVDDCIRNGATMTNESVIHEGLLTNGTCGFLMTGNPYIVVQPLKLTLNESAVIRLYSISRNGTQLNKRFITKYSGRYLYNNLIFMARTNDEFALVVLTRGNGSIGNFSFVYRTQCFAEVIMESFPLFQSPNLGYGAGLSSYETCQYNVKSVDLEPFSIKLRYVGLYQYYSYYDYFTINGVVQSLSQNQIYSFDGSNTTIIVFRTSGYNGFGVNRGFNGTVQPLVSNLRLKHFGSKNMTGDAQIKFNKDWYYIQMFPGVNYNYYMNMVSNHYSYINTLDSVYNYYTSYNWMYGYPLSDAHVMCRDAGYATVERIDSHRVVSTEDRFIAHGFLCNGDERKISQCRSVQPTDLQYIYTYSMPQSALKLTCADNFQFRLSNQYVQVLLFETWTDVCSEGMDTTAPNVLCQEMGFGGLKTLYSTYSSSYSNNKLSNIVCGSNSRIKDCNYVLRYGVSCYKVQLECFTYDKLFLIGGVYENEGYIYGNRSLACQDNFDSVKAAQVCQDFGYPGVISSTFVNNLFNYSSYSLLPISCNNGLSNGSRCSFDVGGSCPSRMAVGIICQNIALAGTNKSYEGRVEIYHAGSKGLLCDDYFGTAMGNVICRQLGFENSLATYQSAGEMYGYGNRIYHRMGCYGYEKIINQCYNIEWNTQNCWGNEVSGLVCNNNITQCGGSTVVDAFNGSSNGYRAAVNAYPWHAHLYPSYLTDYWCSGTILNRYWVLTSASCIVGSYTKYSVDVGKNNIISGGSTYSVENVFIHPDYSSITEDNNIALVKLYRSNTFLNYNDAIRHACLPSTNQTTNVMTCVTTGWGRDSVSTNLMAKPVQIQSQSYCMTNTGFSSDRMERFLCFDNNLDKNAVFNGESGGPLTCSFNGQSTVVGIMARSILGARATRIGLFTRVEYYVDWITTTMNSNI